MVEDYKELIAQKWWVVAIVLLLMPINWLLESIKWKILFAKFGSMSLPKAFKGTLMGVAVGLFTINGVGEFVGRMTAVPIRKRQEAVSSSMVASMAQLAVTITIGGAFVVYFGSLFIDDGRLVMAKIAAFSTVLVGIVAYYFMPQLAKKGLSKALFLNRYNHFIDSFDQFERKTLTTIYGLSLLRYSVFSFQLGFLLYHFGGFTDFKFVLLIPVYYYIQTLIPTVALGEVGVRGYILTTLFSQSLSSSDVILVSFIIWFINLVLPGIIGMILLIKTKISLT